MKSYTHRDPKKGKLITEVITSSGMIMSNNPGKGPSLSTWMKAQNQKRANMAAMMKRKKH